MRSFVQFLAIALLAFTSASCTKIKGNGPTISQNRYQSHFSAISCSVDATLIYTQSTDSRIEIRGQQNILDKLRSDVSDSELRFYFPAGTIIGSHDAITIFVSAPSVTGFTLNGSGELRSGSIQAAGKTVSAKTNGSGNMYLASVTAESLNASVVGSGEMHIAGGYAPSLSSEVSGSGDIDLNGLRADDVHTRTSGSGNTHVWAERTLDVRISGSGDVFYRGNPRVTTNISGSGNVKPN
jgi:hypothetical protein